MSGGEVARPRKKSEYRIVFAERSAEKGWRDLVAPTRSAVADAWDFLTKTPTAQSVTCHPLRGDLAVIRRDGVEHVQWQYELPGGARIWYYVTTSGTPTVYLVRVATAHPNQTK